MAMVALDIGEQPASSRNNPAEILVDQIETFCSLKRPRINDIFTIKEMFYALVEKADKNCLRRISSTIAQNAYIPRQIVLYMALQPIEISTPILLCSPVLNSQDLLGVLSKCDKSHAYIIARRHDLNEALTIGLLSKDDAQDGLRNILKRNPSASQFVTDEEGSGEDKSSTPRQVEQLVNQSTSTPKKLLNKNNDLLRLARVGKENKPQSVKARSVPQFKPAAFGQRLVSLLRDGDNDKVAHEIQKACGLNHYLVLEYLEEENAGTLASILFLLCVPHFTAARVLLLACSKVGRDHSIFVRIMKEFSKLDRNAAIAYFKQQDRNFSLPSRQHHIIEAAPVFTGLQRRRERTNEFQHVASRRPMPVRKAG